MLCFKHTVNLSVTESGRMSRTQNTAGLIFCIQNAVGDMFCVLLLCCRLIDELRSTRRKKFFCRFHGCGALEAPGVLQACLWSVMTFVRVAEGSGGLFQRKVSYTNIVCCKRLT